MNLSEYPWDDETDHLLIDTSPWTSHTEESVLASVTKELSEYGKVVLFHNYPKWLYAFVEQHGLDAEVLSMRAKPLGE